MSLPISFLVAFLVAAMVLADLWPFFALVVLHRIVLIPRLFWPFLQAAAAAVAFLMPRSVNHTLLLGFALLIPLLAAGHGQGWRPRPVRAVFGG